MRKLTTLVFVSLVLSLGCGDTILVETDSQKCPDEHKCSSNEICTSQGFCVPKKKKDTGIHLDTQVTTVSEDVSRKDTGTSKDSYGDTTDMGSDIQTGVLNQIKIKWDVDQKKSYKIYPTGETKDFKHHVPLSIRSFFFELWCSGTYKENTTEYIKIKKKNPLDSEIGFGPFSEMRFVVTFEGVPPTKKIDQCYVSVLGLTRETYGSGLWDAVDDRKEGTAIYVTGYLFYRVGHSGEYSRADVTDPEWNENNKWIFEPDLR